MIFAKSFLVHHLRGGSNLIDDILLLLHYTDILCTYGLGLIIWDWITNWHTDQGTLDRYNLFLMLSFSIITIEL